MNERIESMNHWRKIPQEKQKSGRNEMKRKESKWVRICQELQSVQVIRIYLLHE